MKKQSEINRLHGNINADEYRSQAGNINADEYKTQALQTRLLPFLNTYNEVMKFLHDGARPRTARTTTAWLATNNIRVFGPWPAKSPDMNPI